MNLTRWCCTAALCLWAAANVWADESPQIAQLHVRGEAQLSVEPDQVSVVLGVTNEATTAKQAIVMNNKRMQAVVQSLKKLGLSKKEYKTQRFQVSPIWSSRPRNVDKSWRSRIEAYRVSNTLHITTEQLERIGDIIAATTAAGVNQVNSINFGLVDERKYRQRAITQAMSNAKEDAQSLAKASGDRIVRTLSLRLDNTAASKQHIETASFKSRAMSDQAAFSPPINAGNITVRASVSATFELAPQH